jgi:hypothetical protein
MSTYWENPKAGLSTAFLPKQGFLKLMAQCRAQTRSLIKRALWGWRWVQPAIEDFSTQQILGVAVLV